MNINFLTFIFFIILVIVASEDKNDNDRIKKEFENLLKTELDWLAEKEIKVLNQLKELGKSTFEIQEVMIAFFSNTKGPQKAKAVKTLLKNCRNLLQNIIGGKDAENFYQKVLDFPDDERTMEYLNNQITDKEKKELVKLFENGCKPLFHVERNLELSNMLISLHDKMFKEDPKNGTHLMEKARRYSESYRPKEAIKVYEEILRLFPEQKEAIEKKKMVVLDTLKHDEL